jgi:hypothetical protein
VPHADEWPCAKGETPKLPEAYKSIDGLLRKLALLPPNSVLPTEALRRRVNQAVAGFDDDYGDPRRDLFDALSQDIGPRQQAWHRLRICACGTLFVALTMRTKYCTPECSNRLRQKAFYEAHTAESANASCGNTRLTGNVTAAHALAVTSGIPPLLGVDGVQPLLLSHVTNLYRRRL